MQPPPRSSRSTLGFGCGGRASTRLNDSPRAGWCSPGSHGMHAPAPETGFDHPGWQGAHELPSQCDPASHGFEHGEA